MECRLRQYLKEKATHWVGVDGKEYPKDDYTNHGYGGYVRGFKDLPPEGQIQMAAQAGIKIDQNQIASNPNAQTNPQPTSGGQAPKAGGSIKIGKQKSSPLQAASPLKTAINTK